jgi:membrane protease YdiL (CAAX protease family)
VLLYYFGRFPFFYEYIAPYLPTTWDIELAGHLYLAAVSVITRTLFPLLCIIFVLRKKPPAFGYKVRGTHRLFGLYLVFLILLLPIIYFASQQPTFLAHYPLYSGAGNSLSHLFIYEISYLLVFFSGESLWRGYMLFGLAPRFGLYAIGIMALPYVMMHYGKPAPEAFGALIAALVLGYLALKHKSFWLGVALHFSVAFSMDILSLFEKGQLPINGVTP